MIIIPDHTREIEWVFNDFKLTMIKYNFSEQPDQCQEQQ